MEDNLKELKTEYKEKKKESNSFEVKKQIRHDYKDMKKLLKGANKIIKKDNLLESTDEFWDKFDFPSFDEVKENNINSENLDVEEKDKFNEINNKINAEQKEKIDKLISSIDEKIHSLERQQADDEIEKILLNEENINNVSYDNIMFITIAESGAMGSPGQIQFLTDNFKLYEINPLYDRISKELNEKLDLLCPMLKKIKAFIGKLSNVDEQWDYLDMGMGNYLLIRKEMFNEFTNIYQKDFPNSKQGVLYQNWLVIAFKILQNSCKK